MGRTHAAEEYPNIYHSFHCSDGFAITCKKSAQTVKPFLRYCNLKNLAIWLVDTVLNPNWRTGCDPNMPFSPKWALCKSLIWQKKIRRKLRSELWKKHKKPQFLPILALFSKFTFLAKTPEEERFWTCGFDQNEPTIRLLLETKNQNNSTTQTGEIFERLSGNINLVPFENGIFGLDFLGYKSE